MRGQEGAHLSEEIQSDGVRALSANAGETVGAQAHVDSRSLHGLGVEPRMTKVFMAARTVNHRRPGARDLIDFSIGQAVGMNQEARSIESPGAGEPREGRSDAAVAHVPLRTKPIMQGTALFTKHLKLFVRFRDMNGPLPSALSTALRRLPDEFLGRGVWGVWRETRAMVSPGVLL